MNKLSTEMRDSIQEMVADLLDELIIMDTQAIRAQSQENRLAGVVRSRECGTQTEGSQGVPQERGQKRNIIEVDSSNSRND